MGGTKGRKPIRPKRRVPLSGFLRVPEAPARHVVAWILEVKPEHDEVERALTTLQRRRLAGTPVLILELGSIPDRRNTAGDSERRVRDYPTDLLQGDKFYSISMTRNKP